MDVADSVCNCYCDCSVRFDIQPGREGFVDFKSGQESMVYRAKNGHLMVVSVEFMLRPCKVSICRNN